MNDLEKKAFLFKNDKYEQGGNNPMYKGSVTIDGKKWNLSFWLKQADGKGKLPHGTMFMAGEVDDWTSDGKQAEPAKPFAQASDIPF